jgi:mannose-6-phosphate isomerase-like protein (cupin superfamily)
MGDNHDVAVAAQPRSRTSDVFVAQRPWGQFQQFVENEPVTVKVITVEPGHRLSLQTHPHRDEIWQVLDAPMRARVEDREWDAQVGEQVWVPAGSRHRIANRGDVPARLLEIAFGDFDEADIERLEDDYARHVADV